MPRKRNGRGVSGLTEFPKGLDDCYNAIEDRQGFFTRFKRKERNILEVCRTIGGIEGNGLLSFWDTNGINQGRVIEAFEEIGCARLAALLQKSKWIKPVIKRGLTEPDRHYKFSAEEEKELSALECEITDHFQEAADLAYAYVQNHSLGG